LRKRKLRPDTRRIIAMGIHQIQLRFDATADRLLLQLRSSEAEVYAAWLTRRMVARLLPPFRQTVLKAGVQTVTPHALPVPEARQMLEQAALQRPLPGTQFNQPFVADEHSRHPLGTEPLLPDAADLRPGAGGELHLLLRETRGRQLDIGLTQELATALLRLMDSALAVADWGLVAPAETEAGPAQAGPGPHLN
jgi:hypothetical protein